MANFYHMPTLPEFQLNLSQGDEEDDAEEEKNMMAILMKLKTAQSSMHESKKRWGVWRGHQQKYFEYEVLKFDIFEQEEEQTTVRGCPC